TLGRRGSVARGGVARRRRWAGSFFFQAEDGIRGFRVTGVQTCALPFSMPLDHEVEYLDSKCCRCGQERSEERLYSQRPQRSGTRSEERRVGKESRSRGATMWRELDLLKRGGMTRLIALMNRE